MSGSAARFGSFALVTAAAFFVVITYVVLSYMPTTAISLPLYAQARQVVHPIVPEGWAFFTRNPREERIYPYVLRDGHWVNVHSTPHAEPDHAFGLNRISRSQGVEVGELFGLVPSGSWTSCESRDVDRCLSAATPLLTTRNVSPDPTICGQVALIRQEPVPWAWARSATVMPMKYARMVVKC